MPENPKQDLQETAVPQQPKGKSAATTDVSRKQSPAGTSAKQAKKKKTVQLGDFKLLKKLGQGGMGEVYLAKQVSLDRQVALKILSKEMAKKPGFVERFVREALRCRFRQRSALRRH